MIDATEKLLSLEELTSRPADVPSELTNRIHTMSQHCLSFCVRKASRVMTAYYDELLADTGLKSTQISILVMLASTGPVGMTQLAERLNLEQSTLSRNLKPLEKGGYIGTRQAQQGRGKEAFLTELGLRMVEKAVPRWEEAQKAALSALADCINEKDFRHIMAQLEALRSIKESA